MVSILETYLSFSYAQFVLACALRPDLALMPEGDLTEVGEKGGPTFSISPFRISNVLHRYYCES